jgi:predicted transcriptional regulator
MPFALDISTFRSDRPGIRKVLGDLEAEIMEIIWRQPREKGIAVRAIFEILYERRRIAYTTVMSTMARLAKKRLLRVEKNEHMYLYYATCTEQEFISGFIGCILEDLFVSFSGSFFEGMSAMKSPVANSEVRRLLEEIVRRRQEKESS